MARSPTTLPRRQPSGLIVALLLITTWPLNPTAGAEEPVKPNGASSLEISAAAEAEAEAEQREQEADEDPLTQRQQQFAREAEVTPPNVRSTDPNELDLYGSLRVRYRSTLGKHGFEDGSSRIGVQGRYQFLAQRWLSMRAEAGFKLLDEISALANGNSPSGGRGQSFFRRLLYFGYESPNLFLVFGKTWSTYYKVTGFTDRFAGTGGKASGTYNAGTDGGYTGTGRAENALQTRVQLEILPGLLGLEPFSLNVQLQDGEPIPRIDGFRYGHALGLSALLATQENFSFGIAYNHARIPESDKPTLRARGIHSNAEALAIGARWFSDDWYLATVVARLRNQETTDEENYFDGNGWELYAQRRIRGNWWLTGGWNWLQPRGGQPLAGEYRIKFGVLGLRYSLKGFDRFLYVNVQAEASRKADGSAESNVITAGIRWNF